jgi:hypothetical protein
VTLYFSFKLKCPLSVIYMSKDVFRGKYV